MTDHEQRCAIHEGGPCTCGAIPPSEAIRDPRTDTDALLIEACGLLRQIAARPDPLQQVIIGPGDALVLAYPPNAVTDTAAVQQLKARINTIIPGLGDRTLIVSGAESIAVVQVAPDTTRTTVPTMTNDTSTPPAGDNRPGPSASKSDLVDYASRVGAVDRNTADTMTKDDLRAAIDQHHNAGQQPTPGQPS